MKRQTLQKVTAAVLLGAIALLGGCGRDEIVEETSLPQGTAIQVTRVTAGPMSADRSLTAKVAAVNEVQIFPLLAGEVLTLNVAAGDMVTAGQQLFTVDSSTVTSTLASLQQSYAATKLATDQAIANAQITVDQAQLAVNNTRALFEAGAAASQDLTRAEQGLQQAQIGLASAQAQQAASLAQIQASISQIQTQASLANVTSPCDGMVTTVNIVRGGMAAQSMPAVIIAEDGAVEVQVSVTEDIYSDIKAGDETDVHIPVLGDDILTGIIDTLPPAANPQTNLYDLSIILPEDSNPPIGTFVTVTFHTNRRDSTIAVPTECILTGDNNEQFLFIVDETGTIARRITVETGLVGDATTEVTSGLSEGDRVVTKGQSYLADGDTVRITGEE